MFASDSPTWRNPRVLAILLLVFLSGAVCGGLTIRMIHFRHDAARAAATAYSYETLKLELNLRPDQCSHLQQILADMTRYHQDLQAQMDDWQATGRSKIIEILDEPQRARFRELTTQK